MLLSVFLAILPDFDVIVYIALRPMGMAPHRGFSHTILFAAITAMIFLAATYKVFPISRVRLFFVYFCPILAHLVLDYLMGAGPPVPFFAPLIHEGFLSPVKLIPCAFYSTTFGGLWRLLFYWPTILGFALELLIFVPIIVFLGAPRAEGEAGLLRAGAPLAVSALALLATFYLYNFVFKF